jgi:TatD DNase family protein
MEWIDSHTHLDSDELYVQKDEVLLRAEAAGVRGILQVNSEASAISMQRSFEILNMNSTVQRWGAFGIHPHQASLYSDVLEKVLLDYLIFPNVVALGEIGLDFYYNYSPRDVQEEVFKKQLKLSMDLNLPVVIHCRDAYVRLAEILKEIANEWCGMIHCFTGTHDEMNPLVDLGFYISFSGIVTFRSATALQQAAQAAPIDRILVETDAPFLAPVPHRGKTNESSFVVDTGRFLAKLRAVDESEIAEKTTANFKQLFGVSS